MGVPRIFTEADDLIRVVLQALVDQQWEDFYPEEGDVAPTDTAEWRALEALDALVAERDEWAAQAAAERRKLDTALSMMNRDIKGQYEVAVMCRMNDRFNGTCGCRNDDECAYS